MAEDLVPDLLKRATEELEREFGLLPRFQPARASDTAGDVMRAVLEETARRLGDNYPYFHPLYAGQMLKPPHPVARAAYALAMTINPNNHARDGGRASSAMEIEAVAEIAGMFGWSEYLGHLTSGGTMANLEALWVAGQLAPGKRIVGSDQAHYTHHRISAVLKLEYGSVAADALGQDAAGRAGRSAAQGRCGHGGGDAGDDGDRRGGSAAGDTWSCGRRYGFRVHVDAAYGGYFKLIEDALDEPARRAFAAIGQADSIVIDPHKHGLQPYGCGCVLFRDPGVGRFYKHDSPYTYFTSKDLHLGEISLECSRAGAAAVALWATQRLLPLEQDGEFALGLSAGRRAAVELDRRLRSDGRFEALTAGGPELDIVVWKAKAATAERASELAQSIFSASAKRNLHLALVQLPQFWFGSAGDSSAVEGHLTCLRSVLMKPEHEAWLERIWAELDAAYAELEKG